MAVVGPEQAATPYARARTADLVVRDLDGEVLVYDLKCDRASALSALVGKVWRACDGASDAAAIAARLSGGDAGDVSPEDVSLALEKLRKADLIDGGSPPAPVVVPERRRRAVVGVGVAAVSLITFGAPRAFAIHSKP